MTVARVWSTALIGVEAHLVEVEADISTGIPMLTITGLPDAALAQARDRVRAAIINSGHDWPNKRVTIGLSPASLPKRGSGFDIALAVAVLAGERVVPSDLLATTLFLGELGLDGKVRPVRGVLPGVLRAARGGFERVVVPRGNAAEAALVPDIAVHGLESLSDVIAFLRGQYVDDSPLLDLPSRAARADGADMSDVRGQADARFALEVAAAGGHHVFLTGPPGAGKTMLAERLPGLLPDLDRDAALEVTTIHSVAGSLPPGCPLIERPPYQFLHHSSTVASLVGGGSGLPRPGAASLAHRGVLFLDEAPEFAGGVLDALRQPLESGEVVLSRVMGTARYPARFLLAMAANPCPCASRKSCTCTPVAKRRYSGRLSGPLLDRVDLRVELLPLSRQELMEDRDPEGTAAMAARVLEARARALHRYAGTPWRTNSEVPGRELRKHWRPRRAVLGTPERAIQNGTLTARGMDRVIRVAWTLADLLGHAEPTTEDVNVAHRYRNGLQT